LSTAFSTEGPLTSFAPGEGGHVWHTSSSRAADGTGDVNSARVPDGQRRCGARAELDELTGPSVGPSDTDFECSFNAFIFPGRIAAGRKLVKPSHHGCEGTIPFVGRAGDRRAGVAFAPRFSAEGAGQAQGRRGHDLGHGFSGPVKRMSMFIPLFDELHDRLIHRLF
jgi:hypothetical protein